MAAVATGNCPLASEDHIKVQKKLVSMRSYREELKFADSTRHTRFVCAILGLLRGARIRSLRKKILGWCESALCA